MSSRLLTVRYDGSTEFLRYDWDQTSLHDKDLSPEVYIALRSQPAFYVAERLGLPPQPYIPRAFPCLVIWELFERERVWMIVDQSARHCPVNNHALALVEKEAISLVGGSCRGNVLFYDGEIRNHDRDYVPLLK